MHSLGILAGDTSTENIVVKNNSQPLFRSAGQMRAMGSMGEGISELLYLLCDLISTDMILKEESIHFIRHYLASDKESFLHAKHYLHRNGKKSSEKGVDVALKEILDIYYSKYFQFSKSA